MTTENRRAHDPFAPHATVPITDVVDQRTAFVDRLRELGAAPDVVQSVHDNWHDPEWHERDAVVAMDDEALRAELAAIEREYADHTTDDTEQDEQRQALETAAAEIMAEPAPVVIAWVEADAQPPARATAIEALEAQRPRPRSTVLAACAAALEAAEGGE